MQPMKPIVRRATTILIGLAAIVPAPVVYAQAPAGAQMAALQKPGAPATSPRFNDVMTAVIFGDRETVAQLLNYGRWVDKPDSNGLTPLMVAVHLRDEAMVRLLLERGADASRQAPGGEMALDMARASGEGAIEKLLLGAARPR